MLICIFALLFGVALALFSSFVVPIEYMRIFGAIVLNILLFTAAAVNARLNKKLKLKIFISGFFASVVATFVVMYFGGKLDLDIYPVCVLLFAGATFKCLADIFNFYTGNKNNG